MTDAGCCSCRFTAVAEALMDVREELQKQQEQTHDWTDFALSLCKKLLSK